MAENSRPPVAIRIVRPYDSEDALLESELETIGKSSVVLIGAHPRPTGIILRFEVTLASGATVLRGEGRVLAHKENAFRGQSGLTLRFTRLDPKSKAIVDRATAMREAKGSSSVGSPSRPAPHPESPIADALSTETPPPGLTISAADQEAAVANARASARERANAQARANAKRTSRSPQGLTPPPAPTGPHREPQQRHGPGPEPAAAQPLLAPADVEDVPAPLEPTPVTSIPGEVVPIAVSRVPALAAARVAAAAPVTATIGAPPDRNALLERLRERADKLPRDRVAEILAARPRRQ